MKDIKYNDSMLYKGRIYLKEINNYIYVNLEKNSEYFI